jgi:putative N-acetylmannosamine-6-phosphate epimerase
MYCKINGVNIPVVSMGTSPFFGPPTFGNRAQAYREKFMNNADAMLEIMEACYEAGGRGIEAVPAGGVCEATKIMKETHTEYVVTGSTLPGPNPNVEDLIDIDAKIIFVHGAYSDRKDEKLIKLLEDISSRGIIPGVATHNPLSTIDYIFENASEVKVFLIPFNVNGFMMGHKNVFEDLVDSHKNHYFIGMKTLDTGRLNPQKAFEYISKHNICAVAIGMVDVEEAQITTRIALNALQK